MEKLNIINGTEYMTIDEIMREHWSEIMASKIKPVVYLASPYTHEDPHVVEENFRKVSQVAADLTAGGMIVFSPITYGHTLLQFKDMPGDWSFWASFCFSLLLKSDQLLVCDNMEGWEISKGVTEEISFARDHNIKVSYYSELERSLRYKKEKEDQHNEKQVEKKSHRV